MDAEFAVIIDMSIFFGRPQWIGDCLGLAKPSDCGIATF
jgi:hypothetical protein